MKHQSAYHERLMNMKLRNIVILPLMAAILSGCTGSVKKVDLLPDANAESSALALYSCIDGEVQRQFLFDRSQEQKIIDRLKSFPVQDIPADSDRLNNLSGDIYALEIGTGEGEVSGFWQGGVWITDDGTAYETDIDFKSFLNNYGWSDKDSGALTWIPNIHYQAKRRGQWNTAYLEKSKVNSDNILDFVIQRVENNVIYTKITNNSAEETAFGVGFSLDVKLDGEWYSIPAEQDMVFNSIAMILPAGESAEESYDFSGYGTLPAGEYRIVTDFGTAEFSAE